MCDRRASITGATGAVSVLSTGLLLSDSWDAVSELIRWDYRLVGRKVDIACARLIAYLCVIELCFVICVLLNNVCIERIANVEKT